MRYESGPDATLRATDEALARAAAARSVILVEGISDQIAVEVMAERRGRKLAEEGVVVLPIGGAHAVRNLIAEFGEREGVRLQGLVDAAEAHLFESAAAETDLLAPHDIHVCTDDLEDELIRAVDEDVFERLLEIEGDLPAFRTMQKQPGWRGRPFPQQMHRWLRSISGRPNTYADRVIRAADDERVPPALVAVVDRA